MKTIEQHNADKMADFIVAEAERIKTGVKCPICKVEVELFKVNPHVVLMSDPPKVEVCCPRCHYKTYILA